MPGTRRYTRFVQRLVTTTAHPFVVRPTRAAAIELLLALALMLVLPAVATAVSL